MDIFCGGGGTVEPATTSFIYGQFGRSCTHIYKRVCARTHACTHTRYLTLSSGVFNLVLNVFCCLPKSNQLLKDLRSNGMTNNGKPYHSSINRDEKWFADIAKAGQRKRYALKSVLRYGWLCQSAGNEFKSLFLKNVLSPLYTFSLPSLSSCFFCF